MVCEVHLTGSLFLPQAACWSWTAATPTRWFSQAQLQISGGTSLALQGEPSTLKARGGKSLPSVTALVLL